MPVDVGYGQFDWRLRRDPVSCCLSEQYSLYGAVCRSRPDSSGRDRCLVYLVDESPLPAVTQFLRPQARVVALIKPQFEVGGGRLVGGIVRDETTNGGGSTSDTICRGMGLRTLKTVPSPSKGKKGNQEIFTNLWSTTRRFMVCRKHRNGAKCSFRRAK